MIKIFGQTDTTFSTNGDIVVQPIRAVVCKEDNGAYYLDLETDLSYVNYITEGRIVVANTPQGNQAFRIHNPIKTKHKIQTQARHLFFDAENYLIADSNVVEKDCNYALDHLNSATDNPSPFTTISDITTIASFRCVRQSLLEAIKTVQERWGGHLVRDNWTIGIMSSIGQDNGVVVRYRKNLKEITCEEDWTSVCTKLMPVGKDGLLLPEIYLTAGTQYDLPYTKTVSFDQRDIKEEDFKDENGVVDEDAYAQALEDDLRTQGNAYLNKNSVPLVNYTLQANLEKVTDIGDTVQVYDERLGINVMTTVISYQYNCISERYIMLEFGNFKKTLGDLMSTVNANTEAVVEEKTEEVRVTLGEELSVATAKIWSALGDSYCIYDSDAFYVVDSLPKETATNVIMINSQGLAFSQTGINGTFSTAFTIDGTLNTNAISVINFTADLVRGGTLKLGSLLNQSGTLELYNEQNTLIGQMDKDGLKMFGLDGSYVLMNQSVGFAGFDKNGIKIYWVSQDEFHMRKSVVEEEITLCAKMRFIPITLYDNNQNIVNDGIALVSSASGGVQ